MFISKNVNETLNKNSSSAAFGVSESDYALPLRTYISAPARYILVKTCDPSATPSCWPALHFVMHVDDFDSMARDFLALCPKKHFSKALLSKRLVIFVPLILGLIYNLPTAMKIYFS